MTLLAEPAPSASPVGRGPKPRPKPRLVARWVGLVLLAMLAGTIVVGNVVDSIEADRVLEPLRAAEVTASSRHESVGTIPPRLANRWSAGSVEPTEAEVQALVGPGNRLLEAPFVALRAHFLGDTSSPDVDRCYYLAVQDAGERFDAEKASAIVQVCYLDPFKSPQSLGSATTNL